MMTFLYKNLVSRYIWKRRRGIIANETTLHKRPNGTEMKYRLPYGLQNLAKPTLHSHL